MNEKDRDKVKDSEREKKAPAATPSKKKGFYAALYSCVGVMLVLAGLIGYYNWNSYSPENTNQPRLTADNGGVSVDGEGIWEDAAEVDTRGDKSPDLAGSNGINQYLTPSDRLELAEGDIGSAVNSGDLKASEATARPNNSSANQGLNQESTTQGVNQGTDQGSTQGTSQAANEAVNDSPVSQQNIPENDVTEGTETVESDQSQSQSQSQSQQQAADSTGNDESGGVWVPISEGALLHTLVMPGADGSQTETGQTTEIEAGAEVEADEPENVAQDEPRTFAEYDGSEGMMWPITGKIVMDYSVDHLIFDETLNQYRTNDTLCISADDGEAVKAAASGRITEIYTTKEDGKTVVIDHGNGWTTTYSQLQDDVIVEVGDVVYVGEEFAKVGQPSIYTTLLGSHLGFEVSNEESTVNPNELLAAK